MEDNFDQNYRKLEHQKHELQQKISKVEQNSGQHNNKLNTEAGQLRALIETTEKKIGLVGVSYSPIYLGRSKVEIPTLAKEAISKSRNSKIESQEAKFFKNYRNELTIFNNWLQK